MSVADNPASASGAKPPGSPWRLSIAAYLGLGLGGLVATSLGLLLWVTMSAVFKNTTELLEDKSRLFLGSLTAQTQQFLDATLAPTGVAATEIARGRIDPSDDQRLMPFMRTLLAATPQVTALAFFDVDGTRVAAFREDDRILTDRHPWPDRDDIKAAVAEVRKKRTLVWGPPIHDQAIGTFVNLRRPVFRRGRFLGMVTAVISVDALSTFLAGLETEIGQNAFILYDRDYVLAHRRLIEPLPGLSFDRPLPRLSEIDDPILAGIWAEGWEDNKLRAGSGHFYDREQIDFDYVFLYQPLVDYADAPWLVGSYFPENTIATQFERMVRTGGLSLAIVLLAIAGTLAFGIVLRQPITALASAARTVQSLDLDGAPVLQRSRLAELDEAGRAFNGMIAALRTFSLYVPKTVVQRLMARGDAADVHSELKDVTVMMTDIAGFTPRAERLGATESADFLNQYFALVAACIEEEDGVVDKFIGDGVMAHWGALEPQPDHALRAVRAARRIAAAQTEANRERQDPIRLRIGIQTGSVIAGNIGTAARINYTVVGDTVNAAERLQELGKALLPEQEVSTLIGDSTNDALKGGIETRSLGRHALRGREAAVEVFTFAG